MMTATIRSDEGKVVGTIDVNDKTFKTGSVGYHGQDKVRYDGKRYQTSVLMVEIGSKPQPE